MILERLTTKKFKGLTDRTFDFCEGVTLVVGPNRAGKSSLHQALLTALFGLGKTADGLPTQWKDALPWGFSGDGSLLLRYRTSSGHYLLERTTGRASAELMQERNGQYEIICTGVEEVNKAVGNHIAIRSPSVFSRTVSVAQGDLARLESADRQEVGRALEEVLVGRSGATFQQALHYLDDKVRKPLRKAGKERILQKLDKYEQKAGTVKEQIRLARGREERLEKARQKVEQLAAVVPKKRARLEELTGDPKKRQQEGLLTKLEQKRTLEQKKTTLTQETRHLQDTLQDVKDLQGEIDKLKQQLVGNEALRKQDLNRVERELTELQKAVARGDQAVADCQGRMGKADEGLKEVKVWLDDHPGFRDKPEAPKKAETALQDKLRLEKELREAKRDLGELGEKGPKVVSPVWELTVGIFLLFASALLAWLTRAWGTAVISVIGAVLLGDYIRRVTQAKQITRDFESQMKVRNGLVERLESKVKETQESLQTVLNLLGIPEDQAETVLGEYREIREREDSLTKQLGREEEEKKQAEGAQNKAANKLREFCQRFGLETPQDLQQQISIVRTLKGSEEKKATLLRNRSLEEIENELNDKSVSLRGVSGELELSHYAHFAPTTEEIEEWRREADQLENEVPELEKELVHTQGEIKPLEQEVTSQPTSHELEASLEWLENEIERGDRTVQACSEAKRLLEEVQNQHRTTYLPALEQATSDHLRRITGGFYSAVSLAKGWPDITAADPCNPEVAPDQLSGGSRDQLYFAFRLAIADQLTGGEPLPLLLDEPFTYFDSEHRERALHILTDLGKSGKQVIYFTMLPETEKELKARAAGQFPVDVIRLQEAAIARQ